VVKQKDGILAFGNPPIKNYVVEYEISRRNKQVPWWVLAMVVAAQLVPKFLFYFSDKFHNQQHNFKALFIPCQNTTLFILLYILKNPECLSMSYNVILLGDFF
jgi:hypothetical protein